MDSMVTKRSKGIENPGFLDIEIDEETILPIDSVRKRMGQVKSPGNGVVEETGIQETRNGNNEVRERETIEEAGNPRNGRERKGETVAHDAGVEVRERKSEMVENHRNGETPPDDDCCSICFGDFDIPCKTNCGHWFCGEILLNSRSFCFCHLLLFIDVLSIQDYETLNLCLNSVKKICM